MNPAYAIAIVLALTTSACSTLDKLNPFSRSTSKVQPSPLQPIQASANLVAQWSANVGGAGDYVFVPAVVGDNIYLAAKDGTLARYEAGRQVWRISAAKALSGGVAASDQIVVVGGPEGQVLAFDNTGKELWTARVTSEVLAPAAIVGDLIAVRSGDNRIYGLNAADGKRRWVYQRATPALTLRSHAGVNIAGGNALLAGFPGGKVLALALGNGAALWETTVALPRGATELERVADVSSLPLLIGRAVCAAAYQGRVSCIDATTGSNIWARDIPSAAGIASDGRYLYVADDRGAVHALDVTTGSSIWRNDKLANRGLTRPLALDRFVVVADGLGVVHVLKRDDGSFAARFSGDGSPIIAEPIATSDGFIVQTKNGGVFDLAVR